MQARLYIQMYKARGVHKNGSKFLFLFFFLLLEDNNFS
jgi:hypothetical protein